MHQNAIQTPKNDDTAAVAETTATDLLFLRKNYIYYFLNALNLN